LIPKKALHHLKKYATVKQNQLKHHLQKHLRQSASSPQMTLQAQPRLWLLITNTSDVEELKSAWQLNADLLDVPVDGTTLRDAILGRKDLLTNG